MNRLTQLFSKKENDILNVYFTAGHPNLNDILPIISSLDEAGVDLIELGMPYSDPLADGETIQNSSQKALSNGMSLKHLFQAVKKAREITEVPIIAMGYYNQMIQFGELDFLRAAKDAGIDGLIIPDLPMDIYEEEYKKDFEEHDLTISFLITPETSDERILQADRLSSGFIYVVSKSSITGGSSQMDQKQLDYFSRIKSLELSSPRLIGFGIHDSETYGIACRHSNGAIIGSAFIRALEGEGQIQKKVSQFVERIR